MSPPLGSVSPVPRVQSKRLNVSVRRPCGRLSSLHERFSHVARLPPSLSLPLFFNALSCGDIAEMAPEPNEHLFEQTVSCYIVPLDSQGSLKHLFATVCENSEPSVSPSHLRIPLRTYLVGFSTNSII